MKILSKILIINVVLLTLVFCCNYFVSFATSSGIIFLADKSQIIFGEKIYASVIIPKSTVSTDAVRICSFTIEYDDNVFFTPIIKNQINSQAVVNTSYTSNNKKYIYYSFASTNPINISDDTLILNIEFSSKTNTQVSNSNFIFNMINYKYGSGTDQNIVVSNPAPIAFSVDIQHLKGDVDGDGLIDVSDLVAIKQHLLKINELTGASKIAADYYSKGVVSISDLIAIKKIILGQIVI